ncbi:MAG: ATP-binding protein [Bacteroidota bacterium]
MKFYNRVNEITLLKNIEQKALQNAQMTFITGRRRIGKTSLLIKAMESHPCVYFFVAKKNEALLCAEFAEEVKLKLNVELFGIFNTFNDVFGYLMELSKTVHFTLIIDEFQEFKSVNPAIFSEMQHTWDSKKNLSKINLILCGSVYSMMTRIFEQSKEPLFGRATQRIHLKEFNVETIREILSDNCATYSSEDLLAFYLITGGVAKYVELLVDANAFTPDSILDEVFSDTSLFLDEGKNVLIDEFGKDYGNYFSILSLIASSKTSRVEMESILELQIGGFLDRLEVDFGIISRIKPIFSKPNSRSIKYQINDNFLNFWFRFIYKYRGAIEIGNYSYVKEIVRRDYQTYSGRILEKYFINKMISENNFSSIGTYWEKGGLNEIDIVAVNEIEKRLVIAEVKHKSENISIATLKQKADSLSKQFKDFSIEYSGLSMENM